MSKTWRPYVSRYLQDMVFEYCIQNDDLMQKFVEDAIIEKLEGLGIEIEKSKL